jgi:isopentenyl-diphosphate delta-isomerase
MDKDTLICDSQNITYSKGYIALWCKNYGLPDTFDIDGNTLHKKDHFHVSLLCVKNLLEVKTDIENEILQHFCIFLKDHEIKLEKFTKVFRLAKADERKSLVALCKVSNLDLFAQYLSEKIGIDVAPQPAHVTLYTLQENAGIGLNNQEELEQKSVEVDVPEAVLAPLMGYKKVVVVDKDDNEVGVEYMMDAIKKGLIRRAARIYVFNESGQLLVQQRSKNVLKPLMLDQSAAGHVDEGETYGQAAYRELHEELGIENVELELVETSFRTTDFYNAIYKVIVPDDLEIKYDPEELHTVLWYEPEKLDAEMNTSPEKFTPAFKEAWGLLRDKLVKQKIYEEQNY